MKHLLITLLGCLSSLIVCAQMKYMPEDGFIWQKIVECDRMPAVDIYKLIKGAGVFKNATQVISDNPDEIVVMYHDIESLSEDLYSLVEIFGMSYAVQPYTLYIGRVIYEIQDNRYRCTLYDISWYDPDVNSLFHDPTKMETTFVKKDGSIRKSYSEKVQNCLNHTFDTQLIPVYRERDNW